jgi:hypothetical protein
MRKGLSCLASLVTVLLVAPATLGAQEASFTREFKLRTGYGLSAEDHVRASSMGLGLNFAYGGPSGRVGLEVGYYYKNGDQFIEPVSGQAPAPLSPVDPARSGDSRRNTIEGLSLRVSFQRALDGDWSWLAGLMVGGSSFKHEYVEDVEGTNWTAGNAHSWRDTYSGTPIQGGIKISPFAGVAWRAGDHSSLEFGILLLNYTAASYQHRPGSAAAYALDTNPYSDASVGRVSPHNAFPGDTLDKRNRLIPHLELGYTFHF